MIVAQTFNPRIWKAEKRRLVQDGIHRSRPTWATVWDTVSISTSPPHRNTWYLHLALAWLLMSRRMHTLFFALPWPLRIFLSFTFQWFQQQLTQKCQGHYCYLQNKCRFLNLSTCLFSSDGSDPTSGLMMVHPPLLWLHWHIICSLLSPKHPPSSFPTSNTDLLDRIPHFLLYATRTALDLRVIASICLSSAARWIWLFPWACIQAAKPQGRLISLYLPGHRVCTGSQTEQKFCGFCLLSCVTASNLSFLKPETVPPSSSEQMASSYCAREGGWVLAWEPV